MSEYVLGTGDEELKRLELQQDVWGPVTERFLDRLRIPWGGRVLDLGCGPGFVLDSIVARVGPAGHVTALDESEAWMASLSKRSAQRGWRNVHAVQQRIEDFQLEPSSFDAIFARWVLSFLPQAGDLVRRLAKALRPGGALAVEDYNHEGISLFPESEGFKSVVRATRALYASRGGDTWVAARLRGWMRAAGLEVVDYRPNLLCGGPSSPVFRWADAFFPAHSEAMVAAGLLTPEERECFRREWEERKRDPDSTFFSPIVVDCAGRRGRR